MHLEDIIPITRAPNILHAEKLKVSIVDADISKNKADEVNKGKDKNQKPFYVAQLFKSSWKRPTRFILSHSTPLVSNVTGFQMEIFNWQRTEFKNMAESGRME